MHGRFTIEGFGRHVPERVLTNADLESIVETSDDWITTRTGIKTRHIAAPGEAASDLAVKACNTALADAGRPVEDVSQIFFASFTPDSICPPAACILEHKLGISGRPASDVSAACSGFLFALDHAMGTLARKPDATVLVTASEVTSSRTNWADRATCVLFGDGAGAVVLSTREPKPGQAAIRDVILHSDGSMWPLLTVKGGGSGWPLKLGDTVKEDFFIEMNGPEVYKNAVRSMGQVCEEIVEKNGLSMDDIDLFIPHQANLRIIEAVGKRLKVFGDRVMVTVDRYGNTSAASVAIALADAKTEGRIKPGAKVLLTTFGGGFTFGAALLEFV
ncbi:beta-ketoacyl-ACP synthase III [Fundidesulfovibrio soli]|uniref:beta-ketoacyl-ACP synthase III n=1 Tax=Fundidesulfovibrio soli TaxID=2922716 RepID=UPI001FB03690|nr:beta-ketoacyl-ACP synthase III [Fundidesulfovibrio soli]